MQRIFAILSIVVLLFMQGSPTISWAAETTKNNQDSFAVSAKEGSTQEKATVELKSLVSEHDKVHIKLPEDAAYDEEMTKELEQERSEEHTSELQSRGHLVYRLLLEQIECSPPFPHFVNFSVRTF